MELPVVYNPRFRLSPEEQTMVVIDAIAVLISETIRDMYRKRAATLVLDILLPDWKRTISIEYRVFKRGDPEVKKWRLRVLDRDDHKCVGCGSDEKLEVHHTVEWSRAPNLRADDDNGKTLCLDCHAKEHEKLSNLILSKKRR